MTGHRRVTTMALSAYNTTPRGWDESATGPTDNDSIYSADVRAAFPGGKASGVKVHDRKPRDTPPAREPAVNAKPLPAKLASKFTGIAYAAVETTLFERIDDGVLMGMATDGNGRQTLVDNIDRNLGMV